MVDEAPMLARFDAPVAASPTRLAVLSDLHLAVERTGTWRVSHRTEDRLEEAVLSLNRLDVDAVVFVGDLVQDGSRPQYAAFDRAIGDLEHPFFAVPGNHDLVDRSGDADDPFTLAEFEERYTPGALPYHERIGGIDLLALNSNRSTRESVARSYEGWLDAESFAWLAEKLEAVEQPLVAVHHALPGTRSMLMEALEELPVTGGSPAFENGDELEALLAEGGAPLVLTGHLHFPAVARTDGLREFTLPSLGPYPGAYTVLEIDERGTTATLHSVSSYDERIESLVHGLEHSRVQLAAAQLAGLPLVDELAKSGELAAGDR